MSLAEEEPLHETDSHPELAAARLEHMTDCHQLVVRLDSESNNCFGHLLPWLCLVYHEHQKKKPGKTELVLLAEEGRFELPLQVSPD